MLDALVIVQHVVERFSYPPHAGLSRHRTARGWDILLLAPCWTLPSSFGACRGDSVDHPCYTFSSSFGAWWRDSLTRPVLVFLVIVRRVVGKFSYSPRAGLSRQHSSRGREILLLGQCWTLSAEFSAWWGDSLTRPVLVSIIVVVGRFPYSPRARLIVLAAVLSFAWWGVSLTRPVLKSVRSFVG